MELALCSLYNVIHEQKLKIESMTILDYGKQISDGMKHLHKNNIIHRDLKSANVLLGYDGQLKISDLDSHTFGNKNKASISVQGTVQWMAPELIRHEKCSQSVDVWSFGIILWELLTGQIPYQDWNQQQVMWEVGNDRIKTPIPRSSPTQIAAIISRCIELNPDKRMTFDEISRAIPFAESDMKNIPLDKLEQFRNQWQSEVAETLDDFLRSKATCISDRMEQELVEISQLKAKIQRVYDNILTSEANPDLVYDMVHQLPHSFRSSVVRSSISASQSLPGLSHENSLVFDSLALSRSLSRKSSRDKRKKARKTALTETDSGLANQGYNSDDEHSGGISDHHQGSTRPTTISRNLSWRPQRVRSDLEPTTDESSSNHPQSSGEDTIENVDDLNSSDDCEVVRREPLSLPKAIFDQTDEGFVSRNTTICLDSDQRATTLDRITRSTEQKNSTPKTFTL